MARIARVVAVDFPHHIVQRGNNRNKVFFAQQTRHKYLELLRQYAQDWNVTILAYCLMTNHIHLLAKPHQLNALSKMMQGVSQAYSKYVNIKYRRTGRLWESRYYSCVVDKEKYLWAVARYIEQNPKRAQMVNQIEDYPYSSAKAHILGSSDKTLTEELFPVETRSDYLKFVKKKISGEELKKIRGTVKTGRPLGGNKFITRLSRLLNRVLSKRPAGRPAK
jgi:putative transposase